MLKVFEMFSGYGGASFALKKAGIEHEVVGFSEIDKYAIQCFQQNHYNRVMCGAPEVVGTKKQITNYGDCKLINPQELPDFDLLTGGFPCQAFSVAGKMQGETDPRGTLFYKIIRIAEVKKPKFMLLENVKGLTSKRFKDTFNKILSELNRINYNVYWKVLNSKDFGIPQSRARVFFVCFRKDIDVPMAFQFPEPTELKIFIKDILEPQVDEKYYLSEKLQERFKKYLEDKNRIVNLQPRQGKGIGGKGIISKDDGTTYCLDSGNCQGIVAMRSYPRTGTDDENRFQNIEPREDGCSNTLSSVQKDNLVYEAGRKEWRTHEDLSPTLKNRMGTGGNNVPMIVSSTLTTELAHSPGRDFFRSGQAEKIQQSSGQLRRLTPKECFRLMGFLNDEINLDGLSDTQRYKLAGNGWEINVVSKIFKNMFYKNS